MSIYKDCDIRGIYSSEITAEESYKIGRALASMCPGKILVGGDVRLSTPELKAALTEGLLDSGAEVVDLGVIPTPALYCALRHSDARAGATVTASHNPPEYNGIKFMIGHTPVTRSTIDRLHGIVESGEFVNKRGTLTQVDAADKYADMLANRFRAKKPLHVLVDAGSGAMSRVAPEVFRRAGYRVTELYCEADGAFPHRSPNPAEYSCLGGTGEALRAAGADFGVAFDGDGDRAVFLDEQGRPIQNEKSLVLFIRALLKDRPTPVVYDQKSSSVIRDAVLEMGGEPMPEKSGHAFIKKRFLENGAAVAGADRGGGCAAVPAGGGHRMPADYAGHTHPLRLRTAAELAGRGRGHGEGGRRTDQPSGRRARGLCRRLVPDAQERHRRADHPARRGENARASGGAAGRGGTDAAGGGSALSGYLRRNNPVFR